MIWQRTTRDRERLAGVHPDLVRVVEAACAAGAPRFMVLEGLRTLERQRHLLQQGATKTLRSRHLTGHAVDIAPLQAGKPSWHWPHYHTLAPFMKAAAEQEGVAIEWGGDWNGQNGEPNFPDGPHWQLPWKAYPIQSARTV